MPLPPGTHLGPYELLSPLGAGGMGEVYKARDARLDRFVAVKVLPPHLAASPDALARFEREAKAVASLNHPNILGLFDLGRQGETAYAVMELLEGESLRARLAQGPLPPRRATELAIQMAQGLAAAHEKGVVHRDLKPDNLWITAEGRLKILDFGLAKQLAPAGGGSSPLLRTETIDAGPVTEKGMILGTLGYMSPEQVRGETVDARADLFSFGAVLYEMLTGRRAFARDTAGDTMAAILRDDPPPLEEQSRPVPPPLARILDHCLEKAPSRRFQDARDLAFALESSLGASGAQPAPVAPPRALRPFRWAPAALGALLAGAALLWPRPEVRPAPVAVRMLTYSGHDASPATSPDGRTVAFSSDRDGRSRIWLKQLKGGGEVALTEGSDNFPRFSPDGSSVLFIRTEGDRSSLYRVGLLGTDPRKVVSDATSADWSPKGDRIVFSRARAVRDPVIHLLTVGVGGGAEQELTKIEGQIAANPRWSPDGRLIALTNSLGQMGAAAGKAFVVDAKTGVTKAFPLAGRFGAVSALAWISAEEFIYFQSESVTGNGTSVSPSKCYRQNALTGAYQALFWSPSMGRSVDVLPDGRVLFDGMTGRQNLREYSLAGGSAPRWLTRGNINDRQPVYSRDLEWVIFSSNRSGNLDLWSVSTRTGAIKSITDDAAEDWDPGFSSDQQHLLWSSNRGGQFEIWLANLDGTEARQITRDGEDAENPTATRDGQWVVYASGEAKHPGLWKVHPDGSGAVCVLPGNNLLLPEVSPDGRYVAYLLTHSLTAGTLHVLRLEDGAILPFAIHLDTDRNFIVTPGRARWTPDGRHLIFVGQNAKGLFGAFQQEFDPQKDTLATRRPVGGFDPDWITESLGVSPDGKRLVLSESERVFSVMVAEGGTGVAPARAGAR